jgi:hypothetical protein
VVGTVRGAETLLFVQRRGEIDRFFVAIQDELDRRARWRPQPPPVARPSRAPTEPEALHAVGLVQELPLNDKQPDVLRQNCQGCPETSQHHGSWEVPALPTTCPRLTSRDLVTIGEDMIHKRAFDSYFAFRAQRVAGVVSPPEAGAAVRICVGAPREIAGQRLFRFLG